MNEPLQFSDKEEETSIETKPTWRRSFLDTSDKSILDLVWQHQKGERGYWEIAEYGRIGHGGGNKQPMSADG